MGEKINKINRELDKRYSRIEGPRSPVLTKVLVTDRMLAATVLPIIPSWITPNQITFFRYLLIPFVIFGLAVGDMLLAGMLFALAAFTDAIDGALARTTDQITDWGTLNDPLADKLLVSSVAAVLVTFYISIYLTIVIIGIEVVLITLAYIRYRGRSVLPAMWAGKIKMVLQSIGLALIFVFALSEIELVRMAAEYVLYGAVAFGLLSLVVYRSV